MLWLLWLLLLLSMLCRTTVGHSLVLQCGLLATTNRLIRCHALRLVNLGEAPSLLRNVERPWVDTHTQNEEHFVSGGCRKWGRWGEPWLAFRHAHDISRQHATLRAHPSTRLASEGHPGALGRTEASPSPGSQGSSGAADTKTDPRSDWRLRLLSVFLMHIYHLTWHQHIRRASHQCEVGHRHASGSTRSNRSRLGA